MVRKFRKKAIRKGTTKWLRRKMARMNKGILSVRQPVQYFKRSVYQINAYSAPSGATTHFQNDFSLASLPDFTDFTKLYDAYMIKAVAFTLIPKSNVADIQTGVPLCTIHSVLDYDDSTLLTSLNDYVQYENYKTTRSSRPHKRYLIPAVEQAVAAGGLSVATIAVQKKKQWLDCDITNVRHYGIKFAVVNGGPAQIDFDVKITMYLAMKQVV